MRLILTLLSTTAWLVLCVISLAAVAADDRVVEKDVVERVDHLLSVAVKAIPMADNVYKIDGQSAIFLVNTSEGSVLVDTGFPNQSAIEQKKVVDQLATGPIKKIVLTHFHSDHIGGLPLWKAAIDNGAEVIAHQRYDYMLKLQRETVPYFKQRYSVLYPESVDMSTMEAPDYWYWQPQREVYVGQDYSFSLGGVEFRVIALNNGGEGEDSLLVWLPQSEVLLVGDLFGPIYPMFPNLYTIRGEKYRDPLDYIAALDIVLTLNPKVMGPSHFHVLDDPAYIRASVTRMRDAVQYVYDKTVAAMNAGQSVWQAMEEITLPAELELSQGHGRVSWSVRAIWEIISGWYHYDTVANMYHVPPTAINTDLVALAGGVDSIVDRAQQYLDEKRPLLALRLLDIVVDQQHQRALRLRIATLDYMIAYAQSHLNNYSEVGLLKADRNDAEKRLASIAGETN